jgi:hypothetical protein
MRFNDEFDSNVTDKSDFQFPEHSDPSFSTDPGIRID